MTYKLMVKTHNVTGLKYLCKTEGANPYRYKGSGTYWKRHLMEHGDNITTEIIFETENKEEFKRAGQHYSAFWNVVESNEWANFRPEEGDGGDTVSGKIWITDGVIDKYCNKNDKIPEGWKKGRSTGAFKNKEMQKLFSSRVDRKKSGEAIKKAWVEGRVKRDHTKCGTRGDLNPAKRPEVKAKISEKISKPVTVKNVSFPSIKAAAEYFGVKRHIIDKWRKKDGNY